MCAFHPSRRVFGVRESDERVLDRKGASLASANGDDDHFPHVREGLEENNRKMLCAVVIFKAAISYRFERAIQTGFRVRRSAIFV